MSWKIEQNKGIRRGETKKEKHQDDEEGEEEEAQARHNQLIDHSGVWWKITFSNVEIYQIFINYD